LLPAATRKRDPRMTGRRKVKETWGGGRGKRVYHVQVVETRGGKKEEERLKNPRNISAPPGGRSQKKGSKNKWRKDREREKNFSKSQPCF